MSKIKKYNVIIPKTAIDCNVSEETVNDVVNFYYTELRKKMESLEHTSISIPSLGVLFISKPKIERSIQNITEILSSEKPEPFKLLKRHNLTTEIRDKQQELLNKLNTEKNERDKRIQKMEE